MTPSPMTPDSPTMPPTVAGVDVGKSRLDVALVCGTAQPFDNTEAGRAALLAWLRAPAVTQVVCKPSGGYERPLVQGLQASAIVVSVVHPNRVRALAHALGRYAKTDRLDAHVLAQYGARMEGPPTRPLEAASQQWRATLDRRRQLVDQRVQEMHRLEHATSRDTKASCHKHIRWLDKEMARLEAHRQHPLADGRALAQRAALLSRAKGVGPGGGHPGGVSAGAWALGRAGAERLGRRGAVGAR